jgi:2-polyprenyl-6-hydroxyphenyl methylase/3-demethylubiquinone-9 3-methyltransferase
MTNNTDHHSGDSLDSLDSFDTSTDKRFFEYYLEQSQRPTTIARFERLADLVLKVMARQGLKGPLEIADVGGGAGTLARIFAQQGHKATCIDVSEDLLALGRERATSENLHIQFVNCSATSVPLANNSLDVYLVPELLEHVVEWRTVLDEAARVLRPGGLLYLSTTNTLCPRQDEFELPLYSWYPRWLKNYCVKLARTTQPWLANYGKYPAVHWFTFYKLCDALRGRGFDRFLDRLDMIEVRTEGSWRANVARVLTKTPLTRLAFQVLTPNSLILAFKPSY